MDIEKNYLNETEPQPGSRAYAEKKTAEARARIDQFKKEMAEKKARNLIISQQIFNYTHNPELRPEIEEDPTSQKVHPDWLKNDDETAPRTIVSKDLPFLSGFSESEFEVPASTDPLTAKEASAWIAKQQKTASYYLDRYLANINYEAPPTDNPGQKIKNASELQALSRDAQTLRRELQVKEQQFKGNSALRNSINNLAKSIVDSL